MTPKGGSRRLPGQRPGRRLSASTPADQPTKRRLWLWLLGLTGAFTTAIVTGLANHVVDAVTGKNASPTAAATDVRLVRPFDESGHLLAPYREAGRSTGGKCIESYESSDPDALRCFSNDSQVFDPCWSNGSGSGSQVACLRSPWDGAAWIVVDPRNERNSVRSMGDTGDTPWALEVRDPTSPDRMLQCGFAGGAGGTVAGMRINWRCFQGEATEASYTGDAVGALTVSKDKPWSVYFAPKGSSDVRKASVVTVWR
jgi:hypothetical protein